MNINIKKIDTTNIRSIIAIEIHIIMKTTILGSESSECCSIFQPMYQDINPFWMNADYYQQSKAERTFYLCMQPLR